VSLDGDMLVSAQDILLATFISRSRHIVATFFALNTKHPSWLQAANQLEAGNHYEKLPISEADDDPARNCVARRLIPASRSRAGRARATECAAVVECVGRVARAAGLAG